MRTADDVDGVLITGVYGTGKSSVAAEIAETLERHGVPYGALDLDWLTWFEVPGMATRRRDACISRTSPTSFATTALSECVTSCSPVRSAIGTSFGRCSPRRRCHFASCDSRCH